MVDQESHTRAAHVIGRHYARNLPSLPHLIWCLEMTGLRMMGAERHYKTFLTPVVARSSTPPQPMSCTAQKGFDALRLILLRGTISQYLFEGFEDHEVAYASFDVVVSFYQFDI